MNYKHTDFKHGQKCTCTISEVRTLDDKIMVDHNNSYEIIDAKISIDSCNRVFICQNKANGLNTSDLLGYRYSWFLLESGEDYFEGEDYVTNLKLYNRKRTKT